MTVALLTNMPFFISSKLNSESKFINFDFNFFKTNYKLIYGVEALNTISDEFLIWFIGFTEGDGSFIISKTRKNILQFVITQSTEDVKILELIQKTLGFGKISKQGKRTSRYIVQDIKNIYLLILLFNGNIVLPTRKLKFRAFLKDLNDKISKGKIKSSSIFSSNKQVELIKPLDLKILPSLNNSWLSGFTDAEGCFTVSFLSKPSNAFRLRYIVTQKGDENLPILSHLIFLFNGGLIEAHSAKSNYSYVLTGKKNCYKIYNYFKNFPLKTKKAYSLELWKVIHNKIDNKEHLNLLLKPEIIKMAKIVNSIKRKSK
uniref:LAGLIDADG homing endonuclease n=1 Tax=Fuscoporia gilva TaxID=40471 RepID=UPI0023D8BB98|nr:LAGLIDADG homing endonuclease [Fuscoporia gilva]WDD39625.1 LAGLIDADG homing endonuclease [Fuscoporia gilva]